MDLDELADAIEQMIAKYGGSTRVCFIGEELGGQIDVEVVEPRLDRDGRTVIVLDGR